MKKGLRFCSLLLFYLLTTSVFAQPDFEKNVLLSADYLLDNLMDIKLYDMDNDGDLDYLVSAEGYSSIRWFENDGLGEIIAVHSIDTDLVGERIGAVDLDGDSDLDIYMLVEVDFEFHRVFIYKNLDGEGTFGDPIEIAARGSNGNMIFPADIDEDGDMDLVADIGVKDIGVGNFDFTWIENVDGAGNVWTATDIIEQPSGFYFDDRFVVEDVDSDGHVDILTAFDDFGSFGVRLFRGDGQGNFDGGTTIINSTLRVRFITMEDFNQDGIKDLLFFSATGGMYDLSWSENDGSGNFAPPIMLTTQIEVSGSIKTGDLDSDGDNDILYSIRNTFQIFKIENLTGNGDFGDPELIDELTPNRYIEAVAYGDMDDNGFNDIISVYFEGGGPSGVLVDNIHLYRYDGNVYDEPAIVLPDVIKTNYSIWGDLDSDGDDDAIGVSSETGIYWLENMDGMGDFGPRTDLSSVAISPTGIIAADLDQDNDLDLIVTSTISNDMGVLFNTDGQGTLSQYTSIDGNVNVSRRPAITDIDGDGDLDIVSITKSGSNAIIYFENIDGQGTFSNRQQLLIPERTPAKVMSYDYNNDGLDDIIYHTKEFNWSVIQALKNLGQGVYSDPIFMIGTQTIRDLGQWYFEDIDGDGILDFSGSVSGYGNEKILFWIRHIDGEGTFETNRFPISDPGDLSVAIDHKATDLDLDGDLDMILLREFFVGWYENNGVGIFGPLQDIRWGDEFNSMDVKDIDDDGRPDIITSAFRSGELAWFKNVDYLSDATRSVIDVGLYPNPTSDFVNVISDESILRIELFDIRGTMVSLYDNSIPIDLSQIPTGLYVLRFVMENGNVYSKKVIKR